MPLAGYKVFSDLCIVFSCCVFPSLRIIIRCMRGCQEYFCILCTVARSDRRSGHISFRSLGKCTHACNGIALEHCIRMQHRSNITIELALASNIIHLHTQTGTRARLSQRPRAQQTEINRSNGDTHTYNSIPIGDSWPSNRWFGVWKENSIE